MVWSDLLKVQDIGRHDDFFDLGGDSLLAVRAFERMQALTGINLPLATLLAAPTIAGRPRRFAPQVPANRYRESCPSLMQTKDGRPLCRCN